MVCHPQEAQHLHSFWQNYAGEERLVEKMELLRFPLEDEPLLPVVPKRKTWNHQLRHNSVGDESENPLRRHRHPHIHQVKSLSYDDSKLVKPYGEVMQNAVFEGETR